MINKLRANSSNQVSQSIKFIFDRVMSAILLLLFSPILVCVAIAIYLRMGNPIFFTQLRPGKDGIIFKLYKFRTMTSEKDDSGTLLPDEYRLTAIGKFMRKTSLDELPQLWNVLRGEMSFVGPRPLLVQYLQHYNPEQARRHNVNPGITGWAQVNGRRQLDSNWAEKFRLDVWYVDNWSLWLDLKILFLTVGKVLAQKEITQEGHATSAGEFRGND